MITYTYIVRCPECEDEFFDFFDEAKDFAMGCLTKKPIITQTEVNRNDFGECTDHCDLGTVWSWEDMSKETDAESATSVFNKDDLKLMADGKDPEFDAIDNSVDFEIPEVSEREPITESKADPFHEAIFEAIDYLTEFNDIFPVPENIGADTWKELKDDINYGLSSDFEIAEIIMEYLDKDLAISRKHPEMFEDDPQSELTLETYNRLKRAYDRAVAAYEAEHAEDFEEAFHYDSLRDKEYDDALDSLDKPLPEYRYTLDPETGKYTSVLVNRDQFTADELKKLESCERKPIPEGMTIEQLVEEMEENEDTVECVLCQDLFDKSTCRKELNLGWLCHRCADDLTARGEGPVFKEDNYWDFLDEDVESLDEAQSAPIPNLTYLAGEAGAKDMIIDELLNQKVFGVRRKPDGSIWIHAFVSFEYWGTTIQDFSVTPNGRIMLDCVDTRSNDVKQRDLQVLVNGGPKRGDGSKFLTALKNTVIKLNKGLDTRTRRERRDDAVAVRITPEIAEYLRDHITNIHFKVPMRTYDLADIKNIEANYDASDEACEAAANRINSINDRFFSQPFADDAEAAGMVSDRIPNEPAAWITSSWGAEAKITFDQPIKDLVINKGAEDEVKISDIIQAYQWKASTKVNVEKNVVDCFSLVVELIRRFNNDVRFFEKKSVTEDVADAFDLDFPEV
jgi:hypothetical protein